MTEAARLSKKHQVVIPRRIRKELGLEAGDVVLFDIGNGRVFLKPKPRSYSRHMLGLHKDVWRGVPAEMYVEGERERWQLQKSRSKSS